MWLAEAVQTVRAYARRIVKAVRLKSSGQSVGGRMIYGGKENRNDVQVSSGVKRFGFSSRLLKWNNGSFLLDANCYVPRRDVSIIAASRRAYIL